MTQEINDRRVLQIAIPIMLSNATVPILGAVDTAVVGQLGLAAPIGAVGLGAIILTTIYWVFGFLRMGTAGLAAQALGANDKPELSALLTRALIIALGAGAIIIITQFWLFKTAMMLSPASAEVEKLAQSYLSIRIYGAPAAIAIYGITGWLIAQERTRAVFAIQIAMNLLNIILDLVFVLALEMGVEGVAIATLLAEYLGLGIGLVAVRNGFTKGYWRDWGLVFAKELWQKMMLVNRDIMIRSVLLQIAFITFLFKSAELGDITLAANQILLQFLYISAFSMDGFAFSAEALVGQAVGRKSASEFRKATVFSGKWMLFMALFLTFFFLIIGPYLIERMSTNTQVQQAAKHYLWWLLATPLLGLPSWLLDGVFIGATRAKIMRDMMIISLAIYLLTILGLRGFENHGLWAAICLFLFARGLTLAVYYPALERSQKR